MVFAHPTWLWLLPLVAAFSLLDWRAGGRWRVWTALLRGACAVAVILALAEPLMPWHDEASTTVAVIDLSSAAGDAGIADARAALRAGSRVVVFSARSEVLNNSAVLDDTTALNDLRKRLAKPFWAGDYANGSANLADALRLAGSQIPPNARGIVKLFSSGASDHGDAAAEAWRLAERGIAVETNAAAVTPAKTVIIKSLKMPAVARVGQTVRADITVEAAAPINTSVRLMIGHGSPVVVSANLVKGMNHLSAELSLDKPGLMPIRVAIGNDGTATPAAQMLEDAAPLAAVQVNAPAKVLLVYDPSGAPNTGITESVGALFGPSASVESISAAELSKTQLSAVDAIILADVPAEHLPAASQNAIREAVLGGTGLLLTGATRSFGPGGYDDSELASMLPVKMPQQMEAIDPSTTLVLIIDTSGSMMGPRIDLAKEVARLAISHLKPHDKVGIVEFYGGRRWAAPIQSAANLSVIHRALDRLTAGGGTTLYPAVEEAAFALRNVHTRGKHVLILSDGDVENSPFSALVPRMADDGVTVSTAQVAPTHRGQNQMADIARWGDGRYYIVPDQFALPDLSFKQPQISLTSPLVRTPAEIVAGEDVIVRGNGASRRSDDLGQISGYVRTQAKPTADVLLKTGDGDPLLARWRYGAGFVAALPTQLGSAMTNDVQDKPAFAKLMADLLRQIDSGRGEPLRISTTVRPAGVEADITTTNTDVRIGTLDLTVSDVAGKVVRNVKSEAIGSGHWNVLFPNMPAGAYSITAALAGGQSGHAAIGVAPPQPAISIDHALLDRIAAFSGLAAERAEALPRAHVVFFDLQKLFSVLAVAMLLAHVLVRRWPDVRAVAVS